MKRKKESLILGKLLQKIAPLVGAKIFLEPEWGIAGQIVFKSGKKSYFRYNSMDLNPVGSADIAKDKDYANYFMAQMGYPIVPGGKTFFSDRWADTLGVKHRTIDDAYNYASKLCFPVVVKPNSGSQGSGVAIVHTKHEFFSAMHAIFKHNRVALVQRVVPGKDYRLVVLDDEVISAYERVPLSVTGDGISSIVQLLEAKQRQFKIGKRDTQINVEDPRISCKLARQRLSFETVLKKGELTYLLDNANLSTGGTSIDVTEIAHPDFKKLAISLTKDMGLRLCGVDLMIDGSIDTATDAFWILEINAAPGLDHYAKSGDKQEAVVEALYGKVLKSLDR